MALELYAHTETHRDNTTNCCSQFLHYMCCNREASRQGFLHIQYDLMKNINTFWIMVVNLSITFYFKSLGRSKAARKRSDKTFESLLSLLLLCCCWLSQHWVDCLGASDRPDCWTDTMTEVLSFSLSQFPGSDATSRRPQILVRANDVSVTLWTNALSGEDSERQLTGTMAFIWGLDHVPKRTGRNG